MYWLDPKMRFLFLLGASSHLASWIRFASNIKSSAAFIFSRTRGLPHVQITETE